ncbi:hypothetical protein CI102_6385 [Trichoderma harzianum]|uniref:Uncharacterized protein n=1 Tax=Trichoderma harzianum CBS 226.95 TaxID=983964 RepID=A0A2T4ASX7_TRIHA|nr:hypothetical protein M431DRAFT_283 [Trichoderma harzianum CBS 226.95]PKK48327.1 hypothetical protein CI102_6385 [Trichoderma harzianum]PTB60184.1 hypothetical protein M431DRAFT_283 [Trichoderma harzianum CBS 226.95]
MRKRKASEEEGDEVEEILQPVKQIAPRAQKKLRAGPSNRAANSTLKKSKSASSSAKSAKRQRDEDGWLYPKRQPELVPVPAMAMKRFFSEEPEADDPAKKQVFDKGKTRSVSTPVVSQPPLTPGKSAKASR